MRTLVDRALVELLILAAALVDVERAPGVGDDLDSGIFQPR